MAEVSAKLSSQTMYEVFCELHKQSFSIVQSLEELPGEQKVSVPDDDGRALSLTLNILSDGEFGPERRVDYIYVVGADGSRRKLLGVTTAVDQLLPIRVAGFKKDDRVPVYNLNYRDGWLAGRNSNFGITSFKAKKDEAVDSLEVADESVFYTLKNGLLGYIALATEIMPPQEVQQSAA